MRFGLPSAEERLAGAFAIHVCASSAAFSALAYSEYQPSGAVEILIEPKPWRPRRDNKRRARLVNEHKRRNRRPGSGWNDQTADYDGLSPNRLLPAPRLLWEGRAAPRTFAQLCPMLLAFSCVTSTDGSLELSAASMN